MTDASETGPRISVIVPAYNCAPYLAATLDSVRAQTRDDWECIVVDDGSSDTSAEIAQGYVDRDPRFRLVRRQNAGVGVARNTGYAHGCDQADYVIFLDSDDTWEPDALEVLSEALDADPEAVGAHGLAERMGPSGEALPDRHADYMRDRLGYDGGMIRLPLDRPSTLDCLVMKWKMFPPGLVMVRRPLIARAGLWAPRQVLRGTEDWDMFARVGRYGPFLFVNRVVAHYRKLSVGLTVENAQGHVWRRQVVLRRLVGRHDTAGHQVRLVLRAVGAWTRSLRAEKWDLLRNAIKQRDWSQAKIALRFLLLYLASHTASDLDLRLHGALRRFKRAS